jgi:hypothetical protein
LSFETSSLKKEQYMPHTPLSNKAKISEIARHFGLRDDTTRTILNESGIKPSSLQPMRYNWRDIWSFEGVGYVPPHAEEEFRKPLINTAEVRRRFLPHLKDRAIRNRAAKGSLPSIKLGTDWRFRECEVRDASIHG